MVNKIYEKLEWYFIEADQKGIFSLF